MTALARPRSRNAGSVAGVGEVEHVPAAHEGEHRDDLAVDAALVAGTRVVAEVWTSALIGRLGGCACRLILAAQPGRARRAGPCRRCAGRRPVVGEHRELDRVAPAAVHPDPVVAQDALALRAQAGDGLLGADVADVGVPDDPLRPEPVEGAGQHGELGLGVDEGAPPRARDPGVPDRQRPDGRRDLVEGGRPDERPVRQPLGVGDPVPVGQGGREHRACAATSVTRGTRRWATTSSRSSGVPSAARNSGASVRRSASAAAGRSAAAARRTSRGRSRRLARGSCRGRRRLGDHEEAAERQHRTPGLRPGTPGQPRPSASVNDGRSASGSASR